MTTNSLSPVAYLSPLESSERPSPQLATLLLGQMLNQLRFHSEVAWVTNHIDDHDLFSPLWSQVRIMTREIFGVSVNHQQFQNYLESVEQDWYLDFGSICHYEFLAQENQDLMASQDHGCELPYDATYQDLYCRVARLGGESTRQLTLTFRHALHAELFKYFDLGFHVDQALRPEISSNTVFFETSGNEPLLIPESAGQWTSNAPPTSQWRLPEKSPMLLTHWPDVNWFRQFQHILFLCGLGRCIPDPAGFADRPNYHQSLLEMIHERFGNSSGKNAAAEPRTVSNAKPDDGEIHADVEAAEPSGDLGLKVDFVAMTVTRCGYDSRISLQRRLVRLMQLLVNQPGLKVEWLMEHWDQVGRNCTGSRSTVDDAIADLNNALLPFKIEVVSDIQGGKHLREIQSVYRAS